MSIYEKMIAVQSALKAPKGQYNSFGKYNYRNCEDILEAVKPLLKANGLFVTISDEIIAVGSRVYVRAVATISDGENSISTTAFAREEESKKGMDASQVTGAASSYARKYALNGLLAIDDTKDSDTTNKGDKVTTNKSDKVTANKSDKAAKDDKASQNPKAADKEYKCICCGKPFEEFTAKSNGITYSAEQLYHMSETKNGKALCRACVEKEKEKEKGSENNA